MNMRGRRLPVWTLGLAAGFVLVSLADRAVYHAIGPTMASRARLDGTWWYLVLRWCGELPVWLFFGAGVVVWDRLRRERVKRPVRATRGAYVAVSAGVAGLLAELLKLVIGRERPSVIETVDGVETLVYQGYVFRGLFAGFADGSNLGLPSSHAAVAAGGAFALARVWPRLWPLAALIALGCGVTRLLTGAHFASDVYGGMVVGWLTAVLLFSPGWGTDRGGSAA